MKTYQKLLIDLGVSALSCLALWKLDFSLRNIRWCLSYADWYKSWLLDCRLLCWLMALLSFVAVGIDFTLNVLPELKVSNARKQIVPSKKKILCRLQWIPVVLMVISLLYAFFHVDRWRFHSAIETTIFFFDLVALFGFGTLASFVTELYTPRTRLWSVMNMIVLGLAPLVGIGFVIALVMDEMPDAFYASIFIYAFFVLPISWLINMFHQLLPAPQSWNCKMKSHRFFCYFYAVAVAIYVTLFAIIPLVQSGIEFGTRYKYVKRHEACNSVYYWRTTFNLSVTERSFIQEHNIKRIYLHMFDIDGAGYGDATPIATILFNDSLPQGVEYVPTIYITQDAIRCIRGKEAEFAQKIVTRVLNMVDYHYIPNVQEIQIDGDWQASYRDTYFTLCKEIRSLLHKKNIALSATIRLSNLREQSPPVDYGVLMLYNTNSVNNAETENSILTIPTCKHYLKNNAVKKYGLHLDYAFPIFSWSAVYHENGYFSHLAKHNDFINPQFVQVDTRHYRAKWDGAYKKQYYWKNDEIRIDYASPELLRELKENLEVSNNQSIILYHLDDSQLNRYYYEDVEDLFAR